MFKFYLYIITPNDVNNQIKLFYMLCDACFVQVITLKFTTTSGGVWQSLGLNNDKSSKVCVLHSMHAPIFLPYSPLQMTQTLCRYTHLYPLYRYDHLHLLRIRYHLGITRSFIEWHLEISGFFWVCSINKLEPYTTKALPSRHWTYG